MTQESPLRANQDWDIRQRSDECQECHKAFADAETYCAALAFGDAGYSRKDYCVPCWTKAQTAGKWLSVWRGTYRPPPPKPPPLVNKETVESLLRKLMEEGDGSRTGAIYLVAVMLERKRLLIERDVKTRDDGTKIRVYEHRKTGESFAIVDPDLKLDELEDVREQILEMLSSEGKEPAAEGTAAEENVQ